MSWHVEHWVWEAYVAGRLDAAAESSLEAHVVDCPRCRADARSHVAPAVTEAVWQGVRTTISAPPISAPLRLARRLGADPGDLVVVSAASSLLLSWAVAVGFAVLAACLVGLLGLHPADRNAAFLTLAPLVPLLAIVASYEAFDPLREMTLSTPYDKLRLALLRATAALVVALPATLVIGRVIPGLEDLAFVWLLPSLGLAVGALALFTWLEAGIAGALVASLWVLVVVALRARGDVALLASPSAQLGFLALAAVLGVLLVLRTSTLRLPGGEL